MKYDKLLLNWNIKVLEGSFESQQETLKLAKKLSPHTKTSHMTIYFARKMLWKLVKKKPKPKAPRQKKIKVRSQSNFYKSWEWKRARYEALVKYGAICMVCGATKDDSIITVDHIKPVRKFPHLALDLDNLQILCNDCNMGKSNRYYHDWRIKEEKRLLDERLDYLIGL